MSGDHLLQVLLLLTILLFVSAGMLPLGRSRYPLAKWARWGAIVVFSAAVIELAKLPGSGVHILGVKP